MNESRPDRSTESGAPREDLMTPAEVAQLFHVDPKTVTRWAQAGRLSCVRTLGGHRRYHRREVMELLEGNSGRESASGADAHGANDS